MRQIMDSGKVRLLLTHLILVVGWEMIGHTEALLAQTHRLLDPMSRPWGKLASPRLSKLSSSAMSTDGSSPGLIKTILQSGEGGLVRLGDIATVKYSCYLPSTDDDKSAPSPPFARGVQKVVVGDGTMISGWDKALRTMQIGERSLVRLIDPTLAFGAEGIPSLVPPNAVMEMDLQVLDAQPATANIDFDTLLAEADRTPKTARDIAAAFEKRQAARALEPPKKEGLEGWLEKAKNFYFFGLFEGETGERPPWFLRPSITFPLAFVVVGLAFYVTLMSGAITERGAPVTDELDEIILSSTAAGLTLSEAFIAVAAVFPSSLGWSI